MKYQFNQVISDDTYFLILVQLNKYYKNVKKISNFNEEGKCSIIKLGY